MSYYTARRAKQDAELHAEYLAERKELIAKVAKWEKKVEQFGGEIHKATLARFKAQLAAL